MNTSDFLSSAENCKKEDFYTLLGCCQNSSNDQILAEYKIRAFELHPDKNDGNPNALAKFQELQEAKNTLSDPEKRKQYDKWMDSGLAMSYKQWQGLRDHVQTTLHWSMPKTKGRMLQGDSTNISEELESPKNKGTGQLTDEMKWGTRNEVRWQRGKSNEFVNKFRNYEI